MSLYPSDNLEPSTATFPEHPSDVNFTLPQNTIPNLDLTVKKQESIVQTTTIELSLSPHYNAYPIMGYVYQPTDIAGQQVQVQSSLSDYYWTVDTSNTLTEVYWAPATLTADQTNDRYRPFRLK